MDYDEIAVEMGELCRRPRVIALWTEPDVLDFTSSDGGKVVVVGGGKRVDVPVAPDTVGLAVSLLGCTVFDPELVPMVIGWNIKSLLSYARRHTGRLPALHPGVWDLQAIEGFLGIPGKTPRGVAEAGERLVKAKHTGGWQGLYTALHRPLIEEVLPTLEATPLLDKGQRRALYAHYEVEGQQNGRLRCSRRFERGFLAHTLGPEARAALRPYGNDRVFLVADVSNCEVAVLQWLTGDPQLAELMEDGRDLYGEIYRRICGEACNTPSKRAKAQKMFLAVAYGSSGRGLAHGLEVSERLGVELKRRIEVKFPKSMRWLQARQDEAAEGVVHDYFGRPRQFPEPYRARNFVVQAPAATACLERLVALHRALEGHPSRLSFTVHDGYVLAVPRDRVPETAALVAEVFRQPSSLCPGLVFRVKMETGPALDALTPFPSEEQDAADLPGLAH